MRHRHRPPFVLLSALIGLSLFVSIPTAVGLGGFFSRVPAERLPFTGTLSAVAYSGPCETDVQRSDAWGRHITTARLVRFAANAKPAGCVVTDSRLLHNLIVTAGKNFLVDAWQNSVELEILRYHGVGTGTTAANVADTALETESTTILNPDSTRATGSLTEGATANVFRTVGTVSFDGSGAITEWGLLSQAATGGGVLWSRVVFSAINVSNLDSIQFTYDMTVN